MKSKTEHCHWKWHTINIKMFLFRIFFAVALLFGYFETEWTHTQTKNVSNSVSLLSNFLSLLIWITQPQTIFSNRIKVFFLHHGREYECFFFHFLTNQSIRLCRLNKFYQKHFCFYLFVSFLLFYLYFSFVTLVGCPSGFMWY